MGSILKSILNAARGRSQNGLVAWELLVLSVIEPCRDKEFLF